ncbi:MAG TPA: hypothetical protein VI278_01565, partial [Nitrososphaeraceae archaeon]
MKESKYVRLADTMFRILNKSRIPLFLHKKSNHIFTARQHIVLLVLRQYENKSYRMFVVEWLFETYYPRMFMQLSNIPHYTTLQKFAARVSGTILEKIVSIFHLLYFSLSLPNDLKMYPLKINAAVKIIANIICLNGTCITKATTK